MPDPSMKNRSAEPNPAIPGRRTVLKSAAWTTGASALTMPPLSGRQRQTISHTDGSRPASQRHGGLHVAHEQFTSPQLLDLGTAAERAGFDLLATSDHFSPGKQTRGIAEKHG